MDPFSAVAGTAGLISSVTALATVFNTLQERYQNASLNITLVAGSLWTIKAALDAVQEWRATVVDQSKSSEQLDRDLGLSLESCAVLITVIDRKLGETDLVKPSVLDHLRFVQLDSVFKDFVSNLDGQVRALQLLLTISQWYEEVHASKEPSRADTTAADLSRNKRSSLLVPKHGASSTMSSTKSNLLRLMIETLTMLLQCFRRIRPLNWQLTLSSSIRPFTRKFIRE